MGAAYHVCLMSEGITHTGGYTRRMQRGYGQINRGFGVFSVKLGAFLGTVVHK